MRKLGVELEEGRDGGSPSNTSAWMSQMSWELDVAIACKNEARKVESDTCITNIHVKEFMDTLLAMRHRIRHRATNVDFCSKEEYEKIKAWHTKKWVEEDQREDPTNGFLYRIVGDRITSLSKPSLTEKEPPLIVKESGASRCLRKELPKYRSKIIEEHSDFEDLSIRHASVLTFLSNFFDPPEEEYKELNRQYENDKKDMDCDREVLRYLAYKLTLGSPISYKHFGGAYFDIDRFPVDYEDRTPPYDTSTLDKPL